MATSLRNPFIFFIAICSFNWLVISDSNDNFGTATLCMGNSTEDYANLYLNYEINVQSLLSELASESSHTHPPLVGFFNATVGGAHNEAYGSYLCRGDLKSKVCHDCVLKVTQTLSKQDLYFECFGFGGYEVSDHCMVHYANKSLGYEEGNVMSFGGTGAKVSNYLHYNETLTTTIEGLIREAAVGNWTRPGFETRVVQVTGSDHEKIYILVQCTPDISAMNCSKCLGELYSYLPRCCNGTQGGGVRHANCLMKYNNQSFFGSAHHRFILSFQHFCLTVILSLFFLCLN